MTLDNIVKLRITSFSSATKEISFQRISCLSYTETQIREITTEQEGKALLGESNKMKTVNLLFAE